MSQTVRLANKPIRTNLLWLAWVLPATTVAEIVAGAGLDGVVRVRIGEP